MLRIGPSLPILALIFAATAAAQTPVLDVFKTAAEALSNRDVAKFMEQFDPALKDYDVLKQNITLLVGAEGAQSSIEVVSDEGDDKSRALEIDWLLRVGTGTAKREILKVTVERRGRGWKITALAPIDFFGPENGELKFAAAR